CFMTKCPYVPPHAWNVDFPHLMLRYRAADFRDGTLSFTQRQLVETDRNGKLAAPVAPVVNWASKVENRLTRPALEKVAGHHHRPPPPQNTRRRSPPPAEEKEPGPHTATPRHGL